MYYSFKMAFNAIFFIIFLLNVQNILTENVASTVCDLSKNKTINNISLTTEKEARIFLTILNLNNPNKLSNECDWKINTAISNKTIYLSRVILSSNDNLILKGTDDPNKNETIIYNNKINDTFKPVSPGLLFLDTYTEIEIILTLDSKDDKFERTFEIVFIVSDQIVPLMKDNGLLTLPLNQNNGITFQLQTSEQYSERKIVLSIANPSEAKKASFKIDGHSYGINEKGLLPDIYMSNKNSLKFELISYQEPITLIYWLVTSQCSGEFQLDQSKNSLMPIIYPDEKYRQENILTSMICAQIFKAPKGNYLQLHINEKMNGLPNPADVVEIYSVTPKIETLQSMDSKSIYYFKSIYSFFETDKILVLYDSLYGNSDSKQAPIPMYIGITTNVTYELSDIKSTKDISIDKSEKETKLIFNIYSLIQQNLIVYLPEDKLPKDNKIKITIYDTYEIGSNPVASFDNFEILPPAVVVESPMMRIDISGVLQKMTLKVKHFDPKIDCHFTSKQNQTIHLDGSINDCSWYIPNDNDDYTILSPTFIHLNDGDTLEFLCLNPPTKSLTKLKGPLHESFLPDFALPSNQSYLMRFKADKINKDNTHVFISKKSNFLHSTLNKTIDDNKLKYILKSINYPGNYPVGFPQYWTIGKKNETNFFARIIVQDIQLTGSHYLWFVAQKQSNKYVKDDNLEKLHDLIMPLPIGVSFNTMETEMFQYSGRGFNIEMTYFSCGGIIDLTDPKVPKKTFSINSNDFLNDPYPICIWKIVGQKPNDFLNTTTLNFNITLADKLIDTKAEFHLYDTISIRNSSIHFALCQNHTKNYCLNNDTKDGFYQGSIGYAFIVYNFTKSLATKKNFSISITVERNKCEKTSYNLSACINYERCITEFMACNGYNDCGDWSDELYCNGSFVPIPQPIYSNGVNTWVAILILMPIGAILGILGYIYFPRLLQRFSHGRYTEFRSDLSEVS